MYIHRIYYICKHIYIYNIHNEHVCIHVYIYICTFVMYVSIHMSYVHYISCTQGLPKSLIKVSDLNHVGVLVLL